MTLVDFTSVCFSASLFLRWTYLNQLFFCNVIWIRSGQRPQFNVSSDKFVTDGSNPSKMFVSQERLATFRKILQILKIFFEIKIVLSYKLKWFVKIVMMFPSSCALKPRQKWFMLIILAFLQDVQFRKKDKIKANLKRTCNEISVKVKQSQLSEFFL